MVISTGIGCGNPLDLLKQNAKWGNYGEPAFCMYPVFLPFAHGSRVARWTITCTLVSKVDVGWIVDGRLFLAPTS